MISDFQIALAGIAIFITVAVMVYNRWQESKYRKNAERAFSNNHPDVLFEERVEPKIGNLTQGSPAGLMDDVDEGMFAPIVAEPIMPRSEDKPGVAAINAEIDTIALVLADNPMRPEQFWPTVVQSRQVSKHILWEGLVGGLWQPIDDNTDDDKGFRELRASLQLASRSGPVDAGTLHAFDEMIVAFAHGIGAVTQREDVNAALQRAQAVDAFCADTDIEIAVNIIGRSGVTFATTKVRGLAESAGMVVASSGEYVMRDELGNVQYSLRNMNADEPPGIRQAGAYLTGLSFALDVPRTPLPEKTFDRMMALVMRVADALQGEIVDDNRKLLTANGRKVITETIQQLAAQMQARNVAPGSPAALRLYS